MAKPALSYIALGANLDEPIKQLQQATQYIASHIHNSLIHTSSIYESAPISDIAQSRFYNAVISIKTSLSPLTLLKELLSIEQKMGRIRHEHWGPRLIDLDILLYGQEQWATQTLQLPHPRIAQRQFVLQPLQEIAPTLMINNTAINALIDACGSQDIHKTRHQLKV